MEPLLLAPKKELKHLLKFFLTKMSVEGASDSTPEISIKEREVYKVLSTLDVTKAIGPDGISPYFLRKCAAELARGQCPSLRKKARVVPVHKKV